MYIYVCQSNSGLSLSLYIYRESTYCFFFKPISPVLFYLLPVLLLPVLVLPVIIVSISSQTRTVPRISREQLAGGQSKRILSLLHGE